jgi:hypothetical protein
MGLVRRGAPKVHSFENGKEIRDGWTDNRL